MKINRIQRQAGLSLNQLLLFTEPSHNVKQPLKNPAGPEGLRTLSAKASGILIIGAVE